MCRGRRQLGIILGFSGPNLPPDRVDPWDLHGAIRLEVVAIQVKQSRCVLLAAQVHDVLHAVSRAPFGLRAEIVLVIQVGPDIEVVGADAGVLQIVVDQRREIGCEIVAFAPPKLLDESGGPGQPCH